MKSYILSLFICFFFITAFASQRTANEAYKIAQDFLSKETVTLKNKSLSKTLKLNLVNYNESNIISSAQSLPYYIFNINNEEGFVIVSGNERAKYILGYSFERNFDIDNVPPNMQYWLEFYREEIESLNTEDILNYTSQYIEDEFVPFIEPLVEAKWNQDYPFNMYCPEIPNSNGEKSVAGCVATAMAQVMHYYQWPEKADSSKTYTTRTHRIKLDIDYSDTYYDWDNMANIYASSSTDIENEAVGLLLYHVGTAVEMDYGQTSGAYTRDVITAFKTYFGYDKNVRYIQRTYYDFMEWKNIIKKELNEGRPVLYAGSATSGAHLFVCDGYDENDFFHINWGWGGVSDGYFELTALNPGTQGIGGYSGGYNRSQEIVIGIQKPTGEEEEPYYEICMREAPEISSYRVSRRDTFKLTLNDIYNRGNELFTGKLAVALYSGDELKHVLEERQIDSLKSNYGWSTYNINAYINREEVNKGYYKLYIVYQGHDQTSWNRVRGVGGNNNHLNVIVDNNYTYFSEVEGVRPSLVVNNIEKIGNYYRGKVGRLNINISNTGAEYNSYLFFCLESEENGEVTFLSPNEVLYLANGDTIESNFEIDLSNVSSGMYNFYILYDSYNNFSTIYRRFLLHDSVKIEVREQESGSVRLTLTSKISNPDPRNVLNGNIEITAEIMNSGIYYSDYLCAYLFEVNATSSSHRFGYQRAFLENGEEAVFTFTETERVEPGDYLVCLLYYDNQNITYFNSTFAKFDTLHITVKDYIEPTTTNDFIANDVGIVVYPNPSSDILYIKSEEPVSYISLYDLRGNKISIIDTSRHPFSNSVPIQQLENGIYFLNILTESGKNKIQKFIKK